MSALNWAVVLVAVAFLSSFLTFMASVRWRDAQWGEVIKAMATKGPQGMVTAKICRTCAPNARMMPGQVAAACKHGGVIPTGARV